MKCSPPNPSPWERGQGEGGGQLAGPVNWYLTDNQGTVRDVVQLGDTTPVDHLVYSAFGQLLS